jgi:hypothetical protein
MVLLKHGAVDTSQFIFVLKFLINKFSIISSGVS